MTRNYVNFIKNKINDFYVFHMMISKNGEIQLLYIFCCSKMFWNAASKINIFAINVVYYNFENELMWRSKQTFLVFLSFGGQVFLVEIKSISSETPVDTVL